MQTDDVSTIAAQIANQAELIYQTWKTTGLNPTDLIRCHSVGADHINWGEQSSPTPKARTPIRNISPAPPGASPAQSRKVLDSSQHNGRPRQSSPAYPFSHSPTPGGKVIPIQQAPSTTHQAPSPQQQQPAHQQTPVQSQQSTNLSNSIRILNSSPKPFLSTGQPLSPPPDVRHQMRIQSQNLLQQQQMQYQQQLQQNQPFSTASILPQAPMSPRLTYSSPASPSLHQGGPRPFASSPMSPRAPPPPERSSSYLEQQSPGGSSIGQGEQDNALDILGDPDLEASLRELVNSFVAEDKARHNAASTAASAALEASERRKSAPSSIQEALQRFERQMAITSRAAATAADNLSNRAGPITSQSITSPGGHNSQQLMSNNIAVSVGNSNNISSSNPSTSGGQRRYGGARSDSSLHQDLSKQQYEQIDRSRRSASPNPPVSQPGWNDTQSTANTSTWPLKNMQPHLVQKNKLSQASSPSTSSLPTSSLPTSPTSTSSTQPLTNYITTLEAHVESGIDSPGGKFTGVPLRHKVVTMAAVDQEQERLMKALSSGTLIDDGDHLIPLSQVNTTSAISNSSSNRIVNNTSTSSESTDISTQGRNKPKFSISVTVDVDGQKNVSPQPYQHPTNQKGPAGTLSPPGRSSPQMQEENMSVVDYAKTRYQESQAKSNEFRTTLISTKPVLNSASVTTTKTRYENGGTALSDSTYRGNAAVLLSDEVGSTLPEFYKRKLRKMQRKAISPEPLAAGTMSISPSLPHPELTDMQKAHIKERAQSPTIGYNSAGVAIRPFLTQGSVAERVLIFERAPTAGPPKTSSALATTTSEKRRTSMSTWRDPEEHRTLTQDGGPLPHGPPQPSLPAIKAPPPNNDGGLQDTKYQTYAREPSGYQKDDGRDLLAVSAATSSSGPGSPVSVAPSLPATNNASASSSITIGSPTSPPYQPQSSSPLSPTHNQQNQVPRGSTIRRSTKANKNLLIPRFYYPLGRPSNQTSQDAVISRIAQVFRDNNGQITRENMEPLTKACQVPLYWKAPLFSAGGGDKVGYLTQEQFCDYWTRVLSTCHDGASRLVKVLSRGARNYLVPEDFLSLIQDVVDTHPGLTFLKEATEFHSRYVHTVIARIYYCVNRSWSGRITVPELRRSNLLQVISYLEEEEDINQITDYFSYEHFYVIYCKFWELDTDHDLFIDKHDLAKHNERALSWRMIERIFSGAVTRGRLQKQDRMGYQEFVWFLISEEDKRHPTAIEYWFRCMDLDGDGYLSMYELEYFYEEQLQRMEALGIETLPFHDCLCQMLDMVRPDSIDKITLRDLKRCRMTPIFFDTFFNLEKYLDHEQRDPFTSHRGDDEGVEVSDWDRYAAEEYELLVAEEGGAEHQEDMLYVEEDELSAGCEDALDGNNMGSLISGSVGVKGGMGGSLSMHSPLSTTLTNLADPMDVDDEYPDYADSDDY